MRPAIGQDYDELESMVDGTMESSEFVGDIMEDTPDDNTTRVYIQNLNGLSWNREGGRWPYICEVLASIQADVACFSEMNTDTHRSSIYKPGGTAILACNNMVSKVHKHNRDRLGRWASICFQMTPNKRLRIISAYQVCQNARPGTLTAASQQVAQLIQERSSDDAQPPDPRKMFIHDLTSFIQQAQNNGEEIILAGDFNDDINDPNSGMHNISTTCSLIDLFSARLGTANLPNTYQRGVR